MGFGQNPGFKRKTAGVRFNGDKPVGIADHALAEPHFLFYHVAEHAAVLVIVMPLRAFDFLRHADGHHGHGYYLGMRMA